MFPELSLIKERRKRLGITQIKLAKIVGISQSMLAKIENGYVEPSYKVAVEIFKKLEELEHTNEKKASDVMNEKVVALKPNNTIEKASQLAKKYNFSQFPVVENGRQVGSIRTSDMMLVNKEDKVAQHMVEPFPTVSESTPVSLIREILKSNQAVIVVSKGKIVGIITSHDLIGV